MFVVATVPVLMIEYQRAAVPVRERPTLRMALEGLHFVRRTPVVLAAISLDLFAVLFGGAVALIPAVAEDRLGVGDIAYGWLRAAPGIGAGLMAIVLAVRPVRRRVGPTLLVVVAIFGLGTIVFGLTRQLRRGVRRARRALGRRHGLDVHPRVARAARDARRPARPRDSPSRGCSSAPPTSSARSRAVSRRACFGVPLAIAAGGVATVVIAGAYFVLFPSLRRIDTFEELEQPAPTVVGSGS